MPPSLGDIEDAGARVGVGAGRADVARAVHEGCHEGVRGRAGEHAGEQRERARDLRRGERGAGDDGGAPARGRQRDRLAVGGERGEGALPQGEGPRPENGETTSAADTLPTATAPGVEAGLPPEPAAGPELPAANTGTMPAARKAAMSPSNSVMQRPGPPSSHEPLTTFGESSVRGLPSGSSTHSNARWTALVVLLPPSLKTRAAISRTSGAIATTMSATSVPWARASSS